MLSYRWDESTPPVLHVRFLGGWTWEDCAQLVAEVDPQVDRAPQPVHVIADLRESAGLPLFSMRYGRAKLYAASANLGQVIVVGPAYLDALLVVLRAGDRRLAGIIHYAPTLSQARQMLAAPWTITR